MQIRTTIAKGTMTGTKRVIWGVAREGWNY